MFPPAVYRLIQSAIAHVYPAYRTYGALQENRSEELRTWATYWSILGLFHAVEAVSDSFIWWLPLYDEFKIISCIVLAIPDAQGARLIFSYYIRPIVDAHREQVDSLMSSFRQYIVGFGGDAIARILDQANSWIASRTAGPSFEFEDIPSILPTLLDGSNQQRNHLTVTRVQSHMGNKNK